MKANPTFGARFDTADFAERAAEILKTQHKLIALNNNGDAA